MISMVHDRETRPTEAFGASACVDSLIEGFICTRPCSSRPLIKADCGVAVSIRDLCEGLTRRARSKLLGRTAQSWFGVNS